MGHAITAIITRRPLPPLDPYADCLDVVDLPQRMAAIFLDDELVDYLAEEEAVAGTFAEEPLLAATVLLRLMNRWMPQQLWALIETDYFGGVGDQCAVLIRGDEPVAFETRAPAHSINRILARLGVTRGRADDEFGALGLEAFRSYESRPR